MFPFVFCFVFVLESRFQGVISGAGALEGSGCLRSVVDGAEGTVEGGGRRLPRWVGLLQPCFRDRAQSVGDTSDAPFMYFCVYTISTLVVHCGLALSPTYLVIYHLLSSL